MNPVQPSIEQAWTRVNDALAATAAMLEADTNGLPATTRAQGIRYLGDLLAAGTVVCMEHADAYEPELGRMIDHTMKWGLDAPDCLYLYATIGGDCQYRLHGRRGSAHHVDIQVNWGHYAEGDISRWGTVSSISSDALQLDDDGRFELFLGGPRRESNWIALAENAQFLLIRQYFADWCTEAPADLVIERIGGPSRVAIDPNETVATNVERLCDWLIKGGTLWQTMSRGLLDMEPNTVFVNDPAQSADRGGMRDQIYCLGNFRCREDEAVLIEMTPPPAKFWSVGLANRFWQSLDYGDRQSSLNSHQAEYDEHGRVVAVIAHGDPGIANWLDPCGLDEGSLAIRFLSCRDTPAPSIRLLPRSRLETELPPGTARITPACRAQTLSRRRAGVRRRFRR